MSEDEIIDTITKQLKRKADYDTGVHLPQLAVEGLLDLYQQEKEKNNYEWMRRNCLPTDLVKKLYISKYKIKEKLNNHYPDEAVQKIIELLEEE